MKITPSSPAAGPATLRSFPRFRRTFLVASAVAATAASAVGANITLSKAFLDSVNGFVNFAKPTLGSGSLAITNNLQPGDTVFLEAQTRPSVVLVNLTQGTAANPIMVTNSGGQFIIDYPDPAPTATGIGLWGVQHIRFKGTPGPGYDYGIKINRTAHTALKVDYNQYQQGRVGGTFANSVDVEISQIEIANAGFAGIQAKYEINSSNVPAGYTALLDGLHIHHCYIHDTDGEGMYLGWTSSGHPDIANVSVHDNLLVNTGWDGIQLNLSHGTNEIHHNTILGYGITSNTYSNPAVYFWQGSAFSLGQIENFSLHHNYTEATGMYSAGAISLFFSDTTKIYDNVFVLGSHGAPSPQPGMYISQVGTSLPGVTLTMANNTMVEPENSGIQFNANDNVDANGQPAAEGAITVPVTIVNNIIAHPLAGSYVVNPALVTPTLTTNLFVSSLSAAGFAGGGDYHLASTSSAVNAGTTVTFVTDDFDGNPRPSGSAYDIGAYEFNSSTPTVTVITPSAWGAATGSGYCPATGAFDEQPTWDPANNVPVGIAAVPHAGTNTAYANRFWYIDLGTNWNKIRITQMWTRYRPNSPGSFVGFASMWWDDDIDTVNDGTTASSLNFATAQNLPNVPTQQWVRDRDFTSAPIIPLNRYLVVSTGATVTDRPNEFAFIGYTVP